jgi:hypothetical protein
LQEALSVRGVKLRKIIYEERTDGRRKNFLWKNFIDEVALMHGKGFSDSEISLHFFGALIEGEGVVVESKLSEEYAPGIALEMRPETVQLPKKNKVLRCDHLFLIIEPDSNRKWMGCSIGEKYDSGQESPATMDHFRQLLRVP